MTNWFTQFQDDLQAQMEPWMPWAGVAVQAASDWLAQMPAVVWIGALLWLAMRVADRVQRWGGLRSTAYGGFGVAVAAIVLLLQGSASLQTMAQQMQWLFDMALGWVLFTVGQRMDMRWPRPCSNLRSQRWPPVACSSCSGWLGQLRLWRGLLLRIVRPWF